MKLVYGIVLLGMIDGFMYGMQPGISASRQSLQMLGRRYASTMSRQEAARILNVPLNADLGQIKQARNAATKKVHPDITTVQGVSEKEATEQMQKINAAYDILRSPEGTTAHNQPQASKYNATSYRYHYTNNSNEDFESQYDDSFDLESRLRYFKNPSIREKENLKKYDNLTYYKSEYRNLSQRYKTRILDTINKFGALTVVAAFLQPSMRSHLLPFMEAIYSSSSEGANSARRVIPASYQLVYFTQTKGDYTKFYSLLNQQMEDLDAAQSAQFARDVSGFLDISPLFDKGLAALVILPLVGRFKVPTQTYDNLKKFLFLMPFDKQLILFSLRPVHAIEEDRVRDQMGYLRLLNDVLSHHGSWPTDAELLFEIRYPEGITSFIDPMFVELDKEGSSVASFLYGFMFILAQPTPYTESLYERSLSHSSLVKEGFKDSLNDPFPEVTKLRNYLLHTKSPQLTERVKKAQSIIKNVYPYTADKWQAKGKSWDWERYSALNSF